MRFACDGDHPERADEAISAARRATRRLGGFRSTTDERNREHQPTDEQPDAGVADESPDPEQDVIGAAVRGAVEQPSSTPGVTADGTPTENVNEPRTRCESAETPCQATT